MREAHRPCGGGKGSRTALDSCLRARPRSRWPRWLVYEVSDDAETTSAEPQVRRLPGALRIAIILGTSLGLWWLILKAAGLL